MQMKADLLIDGERPLGTYHVRLVRFTYSGWTVTVPPLHAVVSNFRLILWPQTRRRYTPASLPRTYILGMGEVQLDERRGVLIRLRTGHQLFMIVHPSELPEFVLTLQSMLTPPVRGRIYTARPLRRDLQRIIHTIQRI
ncbi:MAG: hypothetical protein SNJ59_12420 [Aggregatilineales bacterium]